MGRAEEQLHRACVAYLRAALPWRWGRFVMRKAWRGGAA